MSLVPTRCLRARPLSMYPESHLLIIVPPVWCILLAGLKKGIKTALQLGSHLEPCSDISSQQRVAFTAAPTISRTLPSFLELP